LVHSIEAKLVILSVRLSDKGAVEQIRVLSQSGFLRLDEAALKAVKAWKFRPATIEGIAVVDAVQVPIRFVLQD